MPTNSSSAFSSPMYTPLRLQKLSPIGEHICLRLLPGCHHSQRQRIELQLSYLSTLEQYSYIKKKGPSTALASPQRILCAERSKGSLQSEHATTSSKAEQQSEALLCHFSFPGSGWLAFCQLGGAWNAKLKAKAGLLRTLRASVELARNLRLNIHADHSFTTGKGQPRWT